MTATASVSLPADWQTLDIDPETSGDSIAAYCAERMPGEELAQWRRETEARLRLVASQSREAGAISVDFYSELIDEEPWLLSASLVISLISTGDDVVGVADLERELGARGDDVHTLDLPIGPAVRTEGVRSELLPEADEAIDILHVRYFVPRPDDGEITVLAFSTPTIVLRTEMTELFEAIAETFVIEADAA